MDSTTGSRKHSLIRILLAAIIGLAIVTLAAGQTQSNQPPPLYFDQLYERADLHAALHSDSRLDIQLAPKNSHRKLPSFDSEQHRSRDNRNEFRRAPIWYDGIWQDRRQAQVVRTIA